MTELETLIQQEANRCVKCGLCLPSCPTYTVTQNEAESPRGRIALMEGLAKQQLKLSASLETHIDNCVSCRACEAVCPSEVAYGQLYVHSRQRMTPQTQLSYIQSWLQRSIEYTMQRPGLLRHLARILRILQKIGLVNVVSKINFLQNLKWLRAAHYLPPIPKITQWQHFYPAVGTTQGAVALFLGCVSRVVEPDTVNAAIQLLTVCGYDVYIPKHQTCCGAMQLNLGKTKAAQKLAQQNVTSFADLPVQTILYFATGCGASLSEYENTSLGYDAKNSIARTQFASKVVDINTFLNHIQWPAQISLKPFAAKVVIQTPCSLRNVIKQPAEPLKLLARIPSLELLPLTKAPSCCGAAGTYMLHHPEMADSLGEKTVAQILALQPDYLVTSNVGCALQIQKMLRDQGKHLPVLHPITLLAQQLDTNCIRVR